MKAKKPNKSSRFYKQLGYVLIFIFVLILFSKEPEPNQTLQNEFPKNKRTQKRVKEKAKLIPLEKTTYSRMGEPKDVSYSNISRHSQEIIVPDGRNKEEVKATLNRALLDMHKQFNANAYIVFASSIKSIAGKTYTIEIGSGTYAPNGKWENAGSSGSMSFSYSLNSDYFSVGDKKKQKDETPITKLEKGSGDIKKYEIVERLPKAKRIEIFYKLTRYQDLGVGDVEAYKIVAENYKITEQDVRKIAVEGVAEKWPMPPLPK